MSIKIGENLQLLRKEKNMTQEALAHVFNVSPQSVSKWELGISYPEMTLLPKIAEYFNVSIDELVGHNHNTSIESLYMEIKNLLDNLKNEYNEPDYAYRLAKLAVTTLWPHQEQEDGKLILGRKPNNSSYGQNNGGISICVENSLFISTFKEFPRYDYITVKKIHKYLNKISDINTLKVLFCLFNLTLDNPLNNSWTIKDISSYTNLDENSVIIALNNLDIFIDIDFLQQEKIEKYSLSYMALVPILVTMLVPTTL